jgi:hypothetical protein
MSDTWLTLKNVPSKWQMPKQIRVEMSAYHLAARGIFKDGNGIGSDGRLIEMINGDLIVEPIRDVHQGV